MSENSKIIKLEVAVVEDDLWSFTDEEFLALREPAIVQSEQTVHSARCASITADLRSVPESTLNLPYMKQARLEIDRVCPYGSHFFQHSVVKASGTDANNGNKFESESFPGSVLPVDSVSESKRRASGVVRGVKFILHHHSAPKQVVDCFERQAHVYLEHEDEHVFFKRAKYLTCVLMAMYLKQDLPKAPDLVWRPVGKFRLWARPRLRKYCRKNTHLWYSILQSKRAAFPVSDELVLSAYKDHRAAMEIRDPITDSTHDSVMKELFPVLKKIRKGVEKEFRHRDHSTHAPSHSACYERPRSDGGQFSEICEMVPEIRTCDPSVDPRFRTCPDLSSMIFYPKVVIGGVVRYNVVLEVYEYRDQMTLWKDRTQEECLVSPLDQQFTLTRKGLRRPLTLGSFTCKVQAILEPLKVRVISKGPSRPYYLSKDLQKALHTTLRKMDCFRLVGRPLCPTDLIDLAQNRASVGTGEYKWFSVDYSAATDNLSARLSSSILSFLTENFEPKFKEVMLGVLAPHFCEYPNVNGVQVPSVQQTNGQLMGSPLSFPVLCLANLGLYLEVIKEDPRKLRDKLKGVLVNGDDMLYVGRSSLWEDHIRIGESVGLVMSVGKSYCHERYANANSACFDYPLTPGATPWSIPFLNSGLYFGQNKVLCSDDGPTAANSVSVINHLLKGTLPGRQCDVLKPYIKRWRNEIAMECKGRNLFVPISLGGMGVDRPVGFKTKFTWQQKAVAYRILEENPHGWQGSGVLPGPTVPEEPVIRHPWDIPPEPGYSRIRRSRPTWDLLADARMETPVNTIVHVVPGLEFRPAPRRTPRLTPQAKKERDFLLSFTSDFDVGEGWDAVSRALEEEIDSWQLGLRFDAIASGWSVGDPNGGPDWWDL
jgi:hypothetical protein